MAQTDLTPTQVEVLAFLVEHGKVTPGDVRDQVPGLNLSGAQFVLTHLERQALAVSYRGEGELAPSFVPTERGRELAAGDE